jgi:hypothetical protein
MKDVQIAMTIIKKYIIIPSSCSLKYILPISPGFLYFHTCSFLCSHETNLDNYQVILVKLSAGINNLLHRENVLSDISPQ